MSAYRSLAVVEPLLAAESLPPFDVHLCSACGREVTYPVSRGLLSGSSVSFCRPFWPWQRCVERRPHVHAKHECGARWVMAPFDPSARFA